MDQVWEENGSVLGWTCGNMVASTIEVARFFYDLLTQHHIASPRILRSDSVTTMKNVQEFNRGDDAFSSKIKYGAGLMSLNPGCRCHTSSDVCDYHYIGHGGDTYGFVSMCVSTLLPGRCIVSAFDHRRSSTPPQVCSVLRFQPKRLSGGLTSWTNTSTSTLPDQERIFSSSERIRFTCAKQKRHYITRLTSVQSGRRNQPVWTVLQLELQHALLS